MWIGRGVESHKAQRRDSPVVSFFPRAPLCQDDHDTGTRACDEPSSRRGSRSAYGMEMRGDVKHEDLASLGND